MLYPSIQELLKLSTDENGEERLNKYTLVMATAKTARIITNENRIKKETEKGSTEKSYSSKKEVQKDEKAVRTAVRELKNGGYEVVFEGDEGYEDSIVDVRALDIALEEEFQRIEELEKLEKKKALERERYSSYADDDDDADTEDLMGATEVFTGGEGFDTRDEDPNVGGDN